MLCSFSQYDSYLRIPMERNGMLRANIENSMNHNISLPETSDRASLTDWVQQAVWWLQQSPCTQSKCSFCVPSFGFYFYEFFNERKFLLLSKFFKFLRNFITVAAWSQLPCYCFNRNFVFLMRNEGRITILKSRIFAGQRTCFCFFIQCLCLQWIKFFGGDLMICFDCCQDVNIVSLSGSLF